MIGIDFTAHQQKDKDKAYETNLIKDYEEAIIQTLGLLKYYNSK